MDDSQKDLTKAAWSVGSHNESRAESRHSQSSARPRSSFRHRHPFLPLPPRTFYAACQSCGRTFLGLLTAWPAALLPAFAAFLLLTSGNASAQDSVESDRAVLVALYNATDGPNWTDNTHWLSNEPLSEWRGGGVNDDGRVTELDLRNNRLTGEIPVELFQLSQLEWLHLAYNQLTGPIPPELGQLSHVQELYLYANQLTGTIPVELSQLFRLQLLTLDNNQLTGTIPAELSQLSQLQRLHLQHNQLTGPIPTELGLLSNLEQFSFRGNRLTGPLPTPLNHLPDVYVLNMAASMAGPGQMKVTWDDPDDPTASYEYRLLDAALTWTDWAEIKDPKATLKAGEGVTIEWTLTGLPTDVVGLPPRTRPPSKLDPGPFEVHSKG